MIAKKGQQGWDGVERSLADTARKLIANISHGKKDGFVLVTLGNRIAEEANLLGGPLADIAIDFSDKLLKAGLDLAVKQRGIK